MSDEQIDVSQVTAPEPAIEPHEVLAKPVVSRAVDAPVFGHMQCPLLVDEADRDTRTVVEYDTDAAGNRSVAAVLRRPEQVIQHPVECPTCGIMLERHMLVWNGANMGGHAEGRDCAVALKLRKDPRYAPMFAKIDGARGDDALVARLESVLESQEIKAGVRAPREQVDERFIQMRDAINNAPDDEAKNAARLALAKAYAKASE